MVKLIIPKSVWVPFELQPDGSQKKCDDLPRFVESREALRYLQQHGHRLRKRKLNWEERTENEYIDEYIAGVGSLKLLI